MRSVFDKLKATGSRHLGRCSTECSIRVPIRLGEVPHGPVREGEGRQEEGGEACRSQGTVLLQATVIELSCQDEEHEAEKEADKENKKKALEEKEEE